MIPPIPQNLPPPRGGRIGADECCLPPPSACAHPTRPTSDGFRSTPRRHAAGASLARWRADLGWRRLAWPEGNALWGEAGMADEWEEVNSKDALIQFTYR